ncbi:tyrosine-type recombinase/integrase [Paraflavitalea speifideaquila]|uniref:tyrosine-type recombinase/integrase n=1 Tax=Paraflavitalea speifideaquila TaxID=3076558 RepID=UPI0028EE6590|nr:tyrosine-type recombinase/integrase [Paraflavitalea speifideiaquila]
MKTLSLQTTYYEYLLQSYQEWLQTIGYADPTLNNWPAHVKELLHYLEGKNILHITLVSSYHLQDFVYHIKYRQNTVRPGALSSSSINTIINAINSFARYLNGSGKYVLDYIPERAENDIAIPTVLTVQEIKDLYEATFMPHRENSVAMGQRDRAIIAVFYGCGLRKMEGTQLNIVDIDLQKRLLFVRKGKGNKQRHVPIAAKHAEDIRKYLEEGGDWFLHQHYARDYTRKYAKKKEAPDTGAFL